MHLRSVKAQLTNRVACSIAEVDHHDTWQRSRLTLACVARRWEVDRLLDTAERWLVGQDFELLRTSATSCRSMTRRSNRTPRMRRVDEAIKAVVSETIPTLKDPRIGFVTVTGVETTRTWRRPPCG